MESVFNRVKTTSYRPDNGRHFVYWFNIRAMKILHRIHILKKENKFKLIINIKLYIIFFPESTNVCKHVFRFDDVKYYRKWEQLLCLSLLFYIYYNRQIYKIIKLYTLSKLKNNFSFWLKYFYKFINKICFVHLHFMSRS